MAGNAREGGRRCWRTSGLVSKQRAWTCRQPLFTSGKKGCGVVEKVQTVQLWISHFENNPSTTNSHYSTLHAPRLDHRPHLLTTINVILLLQTAWGQSDRLFFFSLGVIGASSTYSKICPCSWTALWVLMNAHSLQPAPPSRCVTVPSHQNIPSGFFVVKTPPALGPWKLVICFPVVLPFPECPTYSI